MNSYKRALSLLLAAILLVTTLAGCSMPKIILGGTPEKVGTVGETTITSGDYLAYMYITYMDIFFSQGVYQYAQYGLDPFEQEFSYGEGDDEETMALDDLIHRATRDQLVQQEAMRQLIKEHGLAWDEEDVKSVVDGFKSMTEEETLKNGISRDKMIEAYKNLNLNQDTLLYGLYGKGGKREVAQTELKKYFDENYVSYKVISIQLTDSDSKELSADKKKEITDQLNGYLNDYNKDKNFEAVVDAYKKSVAEKDQKVEPTKDEDNRVVMDAKSLDEYLVKEIRKLEVGTAKVVEYKAYGSTPTAALILRLDPNEKATSFVKAKEAIISSLKSEELKKEIDKKAETIVVDIKKSAAKKCDPKKFDMGM